MLLGPKVPSSQASTNRRRAQRVGPSLPDPPPAALLSIQRVVEIRSGEDQFLVLMLSDPC